MWRAFFLGIGVYLMIAGAECLAVHRVFWPMRRNPRQPSCPLRNRPPRSRKTFPPLPGFPGSLLSTGAVVCLDSFTILKRMGGGK